MTTRGPNPSIVMTSPPAAPGAARHPRRPPANRSVSLLHSPRQQPSHLKNESPSSGQSATTDSPSSLQPLGGKGSSGESSNAEKWFEKSNNEVRDNSALFADNDPPFFMRHSSSSETPPDVQGPQLQDLLQDIDRANSVPLRTGLLHLGTDGSSTEDFRSVIDDLTVENKKLKRRLKKYEKLHDSHLKDEKLFEVRIHGLPPEKKRELEETLRKFASSLGTTGQNAFPSNGYASLMPMLKPSKTTSSQASLQNADSAYASMSASGRGSSAQSDSDVKQKMTPTNYLAARRQNIHSYLHDIPEGLLPQQNPANMTERAKKKLVVRRMEEVFAGKGAGTGGHQHSIQQQEVSQSAARTDRSASEAAGQRIRPEGNREAHIMDCETEDPLDLRQDKENVMSKMRTEEMPTKEHVAQHDFADKEALPTNLDQRPTRPLDLDPHRAQVSSDNLRYMRHLGFSPLDPELNGSPEDDHGWIYLNFLFNMAQLHTINVTSEFVRKALSEHSDKLEVSNDGRKVRWKGSASLTRNSSSGEASSNDHTSENTPDGQSPRKRIKLSHDGARSVQITNLQQGRSLSLRQSEQNKYGYTPLFFHKENADETDESSSEEEEDDDSVASPYRPPAAGASSRMTSSGIQTSSGLLRPMGAKKQKKHEDGPIIFYNNARFCTDLSGDRKQHGNDNPPAYNPATSFPIGKEIAASQGLLETRGPLAKASKLPEPMDLSDNPIPESMEVSFPPDSPRRPRSAKNQQPMDLEVTGIGGVWPADNFAINVSSRHVRVDDEQLPEFRAAATSKAMPPRFAKILHESSARSRAPIPVQQEVIASKVQKLPPSQLPPALGYMPFDEDSEDDGSEEDESMSEAPESPGAMPPSAAPQPVDIPYASSDEEDEEEEDDDYDDDDEDDGEVDFLAAARQLDPEAVREQEREYEAHMAERLAEEIPAGSSAATAGGGSGFASPASGVTRAQYQRAIQDARAKPIELKRARTTDSMQVNVRDMSSSSEDDDEDDMSDIRS